MTKVTRLTLDDGGNIRSRRIHLREISGDSDAPLETVGQDLRAARLRRGDDLATVSKALKIRKDHLEAIEEDRLEQLPGRTYAIGFVRTYADYLGLDTAQCLERFKAEIAGRSDTETPATVQVIEEDEHKRLPQGWKIIAGAIVILMLWGAWYVLSNTGSMMPQTEAPPAEPKPVAAKVVPPSPAQAAPTTVDPGPGMIAGQTVANDATIPGQPPDTAASATPLEQPLPPGQSYGLGNAGSRVVLRVHQPARVLVLGPAPERKVYMNRTLQPGDTYRVPNSVGLTLTTSNASAVELDLDGQPMGYAGKGTGVVESLSLDPQSIFDRSNGGSGQ
ncbi:MAG: helix-turn-helix domain-containing protein [Proteobacteria bacterium]|nr:helix-turn-helix domain-containing protein [Pseudomonadota bacterium]